MTLRVKNNIIAMISVALFLSSCGTYSGQGATTGATFGTILGSAIGGISGGPRGSDIGTIVGMAGGAMVGAAIGAEADKRASARYEEYRRQRTDQRNSDVYNNQQDVDARDNGYNTTNRADDIIDFDAPGPRGEKPADRARRLSKPSGGFNVQAQLEICNLHLLEGSQDEVLRGGEACKIVFDLMNRTSRTLYNVCPTIAETTSNKHVFISPDMCIESIASGTGMRYTATVQADRKLKKGEIVLRIGVSVDGREQISQTKEVTIRTETAAKN